MLITNNTRMYNLKRTTIIYFEMKRHRLKLWMFFVTALLLSIQNSYSQKHSSTSAHTSYIGLSMAGYQGWFGTPDDGGTNNWRHYNGENGFKPGSAKVEYWPDMREADEDEKHVTEFTFKDGSPATVYSAVNAKSVNRHFQWMNEYGIDGVFVQRFRSDFGMRTTLNKVMLNALEGAEKNNRTVAVMYDIGVNIFANGNDTASVNKTRTYEVNVLFNDWKQMVDELRLTTRGDHQAYLYHNGKPMVALWGVGFPHRNNSTGVDMQFWIELVDKFQNDSVYGGCSVLLGVPTYWRQGGNDCITGSEHTKLLELIKDVDAIMPWHTSRFSRTDMATTFKSIVKTDLSWCNTAGVDYAPCISPGIREKILAGNGYEKYREGGYYFWDMAKAAVEAGSKMLYLGMFDEIDEGTQISKINNNPPFYSTLVPFATYGTDPEDHYLWLAGEATRAMRGEFVMESKFRARANNSDFQSEIAFVDKDSIYEMQLKTPVSGRKVFYAEPYKVQDGAPTVGTKRDTSLFPRELTDQTVTFTEKQRGQYIRFIEVDAATDEIMSYNAIVATHGFATIPYATSFEDGQIDWKYWAVHTENSSGRINVTNNLEPKTGNYHLSFDDDGSGTGSINSADLHVNLSGINTDVLLIFSFKTYNSTINPEDGIYFSNDAGITFSRVFEFSATSGNYKYTSLNINELAEKAYLGLNEKFVVRVQHNDINAIPDGGMLLDDIQILFSKAKSGFAQFVKSDDKSQGAWMGKYGVDGQYIAGKESKLPAYAKISWAPTSKFIVWQEDSVDIRGLQFTPDSTILAARYSETANHPWSFSVDVGEKESNVSIYFLDGDNQNRKFILNVIDQATGDKYDVQTVQNFRDGKWLTWKIKGKVKFEMDLLEGPNAVVSGIFLDPSSPSEILAENFLTFDGNEDFVDCGRDASLQISGNKMTIESWFKINNTKSATYHSTILAMDHGETNNDVGYFMRANGNGQIEWGFGDGQWHEIKSADGVQLFELGTWNHVAGVYDGAFQKIYLNGNLIAISEAFTASVKPVPNENFYIGSSSSFPTRVIDAGLAEVRVWNVARTDSEIKEFATQRLTGSETGLAGYWPINEGIGQTIADISPNANDGILGGQREENSSDPIWTEGVPVVKMIDILANFNGSFEDNLTNWRFYEVPNAIGSKVDIITGDVVNGAKALKVSYVEPSVDLADRSLDNWDSKMTLSPGAEYFCKFWTKTDNPGVGKINVTYGFFDGTRKVISEAGAWFDVTNEYKENEFKFTAPAGTITGWLAFRWKDQTNGSFLPGVLYFDHIQLLTEDKTVGTENIALDRSESAELKQNYPNPFRASTTISYVLPESSAVKLSIYNYFGQKVADLANQNMPSGSYEVIWNAQSLPSGIYIIGLRTKSGFMTRKMTLVK